MTPVLRSRLEGELAALTAKDKPWEAASFAAGFWRAVRGWEERLELDRIASEWDLLDAHCARIECDADFSTPIHAERMAWAEEVYRRLLARDGLDYAMGMVPQGRRLVARFDPYPFRDWCMTHCKPYAGRRSLLSAPNAREKP